MSKLSRRRIAPTMVASLSTRKVSLGFSSLILFACLVSIIFIIQTTMIADGFIKFGYILNTTACDTCDELRTYSGRNVFCCLAQSKCCGPNSLDELEALTTVIPAP